MSTRKRPPAQAGNVVALPKRPTKAESIAAEKHRSLNVGRKPNKESEDLELLRLIRHVGALYGIDTRLPLPLGKRKALPLTVVPKTVPGGIGRGQGEFVEIIEQLSREWAALPDSHPMFDGGRRLLARARASAGPRQVPALKLVPPAPKGPKA